MSAQVQHALDRLVDRGEVPGWSAAIRRGEEVWTGAGGCADRDSGARATEQTVFRIASLTKPIAAVLAMQAVERGEIALQAPIAEWIPDLATARVWAGGDAPITDTMPLTSPVTIWHLLTMTAGWGFSASGGPLDEALFASPVAPGPSGPQVDGEAGYLAALAQLPLGFQPGTGWRYHNPSDVLGIVLARATGRALDVLLQERLAGPLGLTTLGFSAPGAVPAATSYFVEMPSEPPLPPTSLRRSPSFFSLAAGLVGTASDVLRAFDELRAPTTVSADLIREATRPQVSGAALAAAQQFVGEGVSYGFQVSVSLLDQPRRGKAGTFRWSGGTGCEALCDPGSDLTAVLLTNAGMGPSEEPAAAAAFFDALYP